MTDFFPQKGKKSAFFTKKELTDGEKCGILYEEKQIRKGSDRMKRYTAPLGELFSVAPESILATANSGITNGKANLETGWGPLIPVGAPSLKGDQ